MPLAEQNPVGQETDPDRVMPFPTWCNRCGFSEATGRRLIKTREGPQVTWLSTRRMGIRERHHREWLDSRVGDIRAFVRGGAA